MMLRLTISMMRQLKLVATRFWGPRMTTLPTIAEETLLAMEPKSQLITTLTQKSPELKVTKTRVNKSQKP